MNKVVFIGRLTKDPELRSTSSGRSVCNFSIAVNRRRKDNEGNSVTDFFGVVVWNQIGEICAKYLKKGNLVAVHGEIQNRSYTDKNGVNRDVSEVIAEEVQFLTPKSASNANDELPPPEAFTDVNDEDNPF